MGNNFVSMRLHNYETETCFTSTTCPFFLCVVAGPLLVSARRLSVMQRVFGVGKITGDEF